MQFENIKGYTLQQEKHIEEVDGTLYLYEHNQTKAKVMVIHNEDPHKTFGVGFRTPPPDSTGVPHIIEHSVLCGSRKYPLKDPFVELAKGSLNTYLNAMTYPDKTLYPVSSQNDADFHHLMDVYLDAVFFPNILTNEFLLMQEGWRYHLEDPDAPLEYKGVVYNEMKGAFSSAEEVMFRKIKETLFPDNTYGNESGGAPEHIPDLSYEDFLTFYRTYYHPSNAYICLYGNVEIEKELDFIDKEYLAHFDYKAVTSEVPLQPCFSKVLEKEYPYPATEGKEDKLYLSYNCVVGEVTNRALMVGMGILEYVLLDTPASPLKKALIKEGIGDDVFGVFQTHMRQPIFSIVAKNVPEEKKNRFYEIIEEVLRDTVANGVPADLLAGAIQVKEFALREGDSKGYSKGLLYFINSLKSWLYDADPAIYLEYEALLTSLNSRKSKDGYFEAIIETYLLNNVHASKLTLYPKVNLDTEIEQAEKERLAQIKASWSKEQITQVIEKTKAFNQFQEEADTEEALASIPLLKKEELETECMYPRFYTKEKNSTTYVVSPLCTNKVAYVNWYIDLEGVEDKYLSYLGMLVGMLGKLDTTNYSYEALSSIIDQHIGGMEFYIQAIHNYQDPENFKKLFYVKSKALLHKIPKQVEMMKEILTQTSLEDTARIREIIREMKSIMEMALSGEGHKVATGRLLSHLAGIEVFEEETKGLTFYHFVCNLDKAWEEKEAELMMNLKQAYHYLCNGIRYTVGLTIDEEHVEEAMEQIQVAIDELPQEPIAPLCHKFTTSPIQEGLVYPGNVNYVAMGYNYKQKGYAYSGSLLMLKSILSMDYLWNNVRVKNGAYGCFADIRKSGNMVFVSYRDPNIVPTLDIYKAMPDYIAHLDLSPRELDQYLIGTISSLDFPFTPSTEGVTAQMYYFTGTPREEVQKTRDELFATDNATLRNYAPLVEAVLSENQYCVFGNTTSIAENKDLFKKITTV